MMSDINREFKKNQLRSRIITTEDLGRTGQTGAAGDNTGGLDSSLSNFKRLRPADAPTNEELAERPIQRAHRKVLRRRAVIIIVLLALLLGALGGIYWYQRFFRFENTTVVWERQFDRTEEGYSAYVRYGDNLLKYSRDGASYIDGSGNDVWIQSYEMNNPIVAVSGDYAAIADQQGNDIYICSVSGLQGIATTVLPISKVSVSSRGMVAAILEDKTSTEINYFQQDGTEMEIYIRGLLESDGNQDDWGIGYSLDVDLSPDGNMLMGSYFSVQGGQLRNRVAFYNFSEVGKNALNRLVGGFHEIYENSMVARVAYLNDTYSVAFADNSLSFYSSKDEMSPEMVKLVPIEEEICSVFYDDEYVGIIVNSASGEYEYRMDLYRADGGQVFSKGFNYEYSHVDVDGGMVFLYNQDSCRVYNRYGNLKYEGTFDYQVDKITRGRLPNEIIVTGPQIMQKIMMH